MLKRHICVVGHCKYVSCECFLVGLADISFPDTVEDMRQSQTAVCTVSSPQRQSDWEQILLMDFTLNGCLTFICQFSNMKGFPIRLLLKATFYSSNNGMITQALWKIKYILLTYMFSETHTHRNSWGCRWEGKQEDRKLKSVSQSDLRTHCDHPIST